MDCKSRQDILNEILEYYSHQNDADAQENLVAMLREIQELWDCIPLDIQERAAKLLNIKPAVISSIIKLYPSLTSAPYQHRVTICLGQRCAAKDADALMSALRKAVEGKAFMIETRNCLKQCRTAPNLTVDNRCYPSVRPEDIEDIVKDYS